MATTSQQDSELLKTIHLLRILTKDSITMFMD